MAVDAGTLDNRVVLVADGWAVITDRDHTATLHVAGRSKVATRLG
ncbi:hypothetical protein [Humibacillus sp. DSM 29435]|nr:hypothetical protein [Humibacillus sp. DSM 29435]